MEKKIIYTESAPDPRFLWLHHKNDDLVLEGFGIRGWESVGQEAINTEELKKEIAMAIQPQKTKAIKTSLPKLSEDCSKKEMISTIERLKAVLVKAGIIEIG